MIDFSNPWLWVYGVFVAVLVAGIILVGIGVVVSQERKRNNDDDCNH